MTVYGLSDGARASTALPSGIPLGRPFLVGLTLLALAGAVLAGPALAVRDADPDLARLLRAMAALKGLFALAAFAACYWRLARPAAWRTPFYVLSPGLMAGGAACLWQLQATGWAAAILHLALLGLLAAALTDPAFIPDFPRRRPPSVGPRSAGRAPPR